MSDENARRLSWFWWVILFLVIVLVASFVVFDTYSWQTFVFAFKWLLGPVAALFLIANISWRYRQWWRNKPSEHWIFIIAKQLGTAVVSMALLGPWVMLVNIALGSSEVQEIRGELYSSRHGSGSNYWFEIDTEDGRITIGVTAAESERWSSGEQVVLRRREGGLGIWYRYRWDE